MTQWQADRQVEVRHVQGVPRLPHLLLLTRCVFWRLTSILLWGFTNVRNFLGRLSLVSRWRDTALKLGIGQYALQHGHFRTRVRAEQVLAQQSRILCHGVVSAHSDDRHLGTPPRNTPSSDGRTQWSPYPGAVTQTTCWLFCRDRLPRTDRSTDSTWRTADTPVREVLAKRRLGLDDGRLASKSSRCAENSRSPLDHARREGSSDRSLTVQDRP